MDKEFVSPLEQFIAESDQYFYGDNFWQAPLFKQVEGLSIDQVLWRPAEDKHCIWQILRHLNYWKYWAIKYAKEGIKEKAKDFNWAPLPEEKSQKNWLAELEYTKKLHEDFKTLCSSYGDKLFGLPDEKIVFLRTVLYHDAYHSGQIGILRSLQKIEPVV